MPCASNHFYDEGTKELEYVNRLGNFRAGHALMLEGFQVPEMCENSQGWSFSHYSTQYAI